MTALVGILNKRAAVMAADSAVTTTNGGKTKIYNSATKIFKLSNEHPVGVMVYSAAKFMDIPWEIIFNLYRDRKGNKEYKSLKGYMEGFIDFLRSEKFFADEESQKDYIESEILKYYYSVREDVVDSYTEARNQRSDDDTAADDDPDLLLDILKNSIDASIKVCGEEKDNAEVASLSIGSIRKYCAEAFDKLMELCAEDGLPDNTRELWEKGFYAYIRSNYFLLYPGLVFVGYGSDDIFPSLLPIMVSGAFDNRLRYCIDEENVTTISRDDSVCIIPFAQTDVMMSLMKGISPNMHRQVFEGNATVVEETRQKMIEAMREAGVDNATIEKMVSLDMTETKNRFADTLGEYIQDEYIEGIVDAVDSFNIEEMANMAESLISVTTLQRHISSEEESVGGPIDVAVLTRSEGFVWVKHKEWYKTN